MKGFRVHPMREDMSLYLSRVGYKNGNLTISVKAGCDEFLDSFRGLSDVLVDEIK